MVSSGSHLPSLMSPSFRVRRASAPVLPGRGAVFWPWCRSGWSWWLRIGRFAAASALAQPASSVAASGIGPGVPGGMLWRFSLFFKHHVFETIEVSDRGGGHPWPNPIGFSLGRWAFLSAWPWGVLGYCERGGLCRAIFVVPLPPGARLRWSASRSSLLLLAVLSFCWPLSWS